MKYDVIVREEHKLQVSQNKVLKEILGHTRDYVSKKIRMSHNKELCDFYKSCSIFRLVKSRKGQTWGSDGERRNAYGILEGSLSEDGHVGDESMLGKLVLRMGAGTG